MQVVRAFWDALPDAKITAVDLVAAGNVVLAEATIAGTHDGTFRTPQARDFPHWEPGEPSLSGGQAIRGRPACLGAPVLRSTELLQQLGAMN
jgi:hypothetical protein